MKYLPCSRCRQPALATKAGLLQCMGTMHDPSITYLCRRCGHNNQLTALEFSRLPAMTAGEISAVTCDLPLPTVEDDRPAS